MAFVYRTVPSLTSTIKKFGSLNREQQNLEGIMYDLGYILFEDVYPFFQRTERMVNTFKLLNENYKFFFLFSYDALMDTFSSAEGSCYEKCNFELLEYNIPNEILLKYCGYGFYKGCAHVEFCIPESEFEKVSPSVVNIESLTNELSEYEKLKDRFHFENKRAYSTNSITGKRNLCDVSELYDENGLLAFQRIIEQLRLKGVINPNNIFEIYKIFKKQSYDVDRDKEREVKKLQKKLEIILE